MGWISVFGEAFFKQEISATATGVRLKKGVTHIEYMLQKHNLIKEK